MVMEIPITLHDSIKPADLVRREYLYLSKLSEVVDSYGTPSCAFLQPESHCVLEQIFIHSLNAVWRLGYVCSRSEPERSKGERQRSRGPQPTEPNWIQTNLATKRDETEPVA